MGRVERRRRGRCSASFSNCALARALYRDGPLVRGLVDDHGDNPSAPLSRGERRSVGRTSSGLVEVSKVEPKRRRVLERLACCPPGTPKDRSPFKLPYG